MASFEGLCAIDFVIWLVSRSNGTYRKKVRRMIKDLCGVE
jgi:hypothetical protein